MTFRTIFFLGIIIAALLIAYFNRINSVLICGKVFDVPDDCTVPSPTYLKCADYDLSWLHVDDNTHDYIARDLLVKREKERNYKKSEIQCFIMNQESKGFKLQAASSSEKNCIFIIHGKVNHQAVVITLSMPFEPRSTKELPVFVRKIIQLKD
ncbi:MAG: hypothetical protein ACK4RF_00600 [Cyclobacteriaceae bacterium]